MLLLEFPQFGVDIEGPSKVGLPLLVSILREVSATKSNINETQHQTKSYTSLHNNNNNGNVEVPKNY